MESKGISGAQSDPGTGASEAVGARPALGTPDGELPEEVRLRLPELDPAALGEFYEVWFDRIYGYVRRMIGEDHLAEDVTQDVFMHLYRSFAAYDPARALRPWVFTIATNKVRDFWRSRRFRDTLRESSYDEPEGEPWAESEERRPEQHLANSELGRMLEAAIERLPEGMRTTLVLRYFEELSFEEIGRIVERNETAVRKRYSRALEELRRDLGGVLDVEDEG